MDAVAGLRRRRNRAAFSGLLTAGGHCGIITYSGSDLDEITPNELPACELGPALQPDPL
jgi:hypothetical protein